MAGLFGNLPPVTQSPSLEDVDTEIIEEPASKKPRREEESIPNESSDLAASPPPKKKAADEELEQPPPSQPTDQILAAIYRITSHISNPKKFCKASELLRQLLAQPTGTTLDPRKHGNAVFNALVASMEEDPTRSNDLLLAREYSKLFTVASKHPELFSPAQRAQLDVYGLWAVVLNQLLTTDDSFIFSKTVNTIKEMISELPALESPEQVEEEEKALVSPYEIEVKDVGTILPTAVAKEDGEVVEVDQNNNEDTRVWSEVAVIAHRRAALVACIQKCGKECYKKIWAQTSIDLLVEHASKHAQHTNQHFLSSQCAGIEEMVAFVREQKVARKTKGGGGSGGGDASAFDRARSEWGKTTMSYRGGVGSGGDHKSEAWLG